MNTATELAKQLKAEFGKLISKPTKFRGETTLNIADAERG